MRKLIALVLVPAAVAGLAACGGGGAKAAVQPDTTTAAPTAQVPTTAAPTTTVPVTTTPKPIPTPKPTTPPTTAAPKKGARTNPYDLNAGDMLSVKGEWTAMILAQLEDVDPALIQQANRYNDSAPEGQKYVRMFFTGSYEGTESQSGSSAAYELKLVGAKNKVYDRSYVSDSHDVLGALSEQDDVISGGTLTGWIYYLVDADDTGLVAARQASGTMQFVIPAAVAPEG